MNARHLPSNTLHATLLSSPSPLLALLTSLHVSTHLTAFLQDEAKSTMFSSHPSPTHVNCVPLEDAKLEEELQFDFPLLEQLLHLALSLVQLLQHTLDVGHGAVMGSLVAGDGRVSVQGSQRQIELDPDV